MNMKNITKLIGILVASTMLFACDSSGSSKPVKMVKVWKISEVARYDAQEKLQEKTKNYYDNNGLLYKKESFDLTRGVDGYYKYTYTNGVVSKEENFVIDPNSSTDSLYKVTKMDNQGTVELSKATDFTHKYNNTYDNNNPEHLLKRKQYRDSVVFYTMDYTFNDNTVEIIQTREKTGSKTWNKFTYNDERNLASIEARRDNSAGDLKSKYTYEYFDENDDGRIDKQTYDNSNVGLIWVKTFKWEEYNVTEASTQQTIKGCRVKLGGCTKRVNDLYALPMMNYVQ